MSYPDCGCGHPWREHLDYDGRTNCKHVPCFCLAYDPPTICKRCRAVVADGAHCGRCGAAVADEAENDSPPSRSGMTSGDWMSVCLCLCTVVFGSFVSDCRMSRDIVALTRTANEQTACIVALNACASQAAADIRELRERVP